MDVQGSGGSHLPQAGWISNPKSHCRLPGQGNACHRLFGFVPVGQSAFVSGPSQVVAVNSIAFHSRHTITSAAASTPVHDSCQSDPWARQSPAAVGTNNSSCRNKAQAICARAAMAASASWTMLALSIHLSDSWTVASCSFSPPQLQSWQKLSCTSKPITL